MQPRTMVISDARDVAMLEQTPRRRRWEVPRWPELLSRSLLGLLAASSALVSLATGLPVVGLLGVLVLLLLTPLARSLVTRAMIAMLVVLASGGVAAHLSGIVWSTTWLAGSVLGLAVVQLVVSLRRPWRPLLPAVGVADRVALLAGLATVAVLGMPYVGASPDDVVLDLARGFDPVNHVAMTANVVAEGGTGWASPATVSQLGSAAAYGDYPLGLHTAVAGALELAGLATSREELVRGYAWVIVLALGVCSAVLGSIAARVARDVGPSDSGASREVAAAAVVAGCLLLGGMFVAPFELGHGPFVIAATAGIATSWLVLGKSGASGGGRVAALSVGCVAVLGAYPPLAIGLVPAVCYALSALLPLKRRYAAVLFGVGLPIAGALALWTWRSRIGHLIDAVGEHSTPLALSLVLVAVTSAGVWLVRDRSPSALPLRALAVAVGYLTGALLIALAGAWSGRPPGTNYYAAKLGEAAWIAALPVLAALVAYAAIELTQGARARIRVPMRVLSLTCVVLGIAVLPVGRAQSGLAGPATLAQRMLEADRARNEVRVTEAARLAGPSQGDASAMVEPAGWFHKVSREDAPAGQWERSATSAALWMATLRGVRTEQSDAVAHCFVDRGDARAIPCVESWLDGDSARSITIGVRDSPSAPAFEEWGRDHPHQVRIVTLGS
ncbi:MAG: hypothetical protein WCF36_22145 [Candidatus Nanopelagicales bacterium]